MFIRLNISIITSLSSDITKSESIIFSISSIYSSLGMGMVHLTWQIGNLEMFFF